MVDILRYFGIFDGYFRQGGAEGPEHGSLGLRGFQRWCEADGSPVQLRVLSWLESLGSAFQQRSGLPLSERLLDGLASPALGFTPQRAIGGQAGLRRRFDALSPQQLQRLYANHSSSGLMSRKEFDTWFVAIGVTNPHMRERLFSVSQSRAMVAGGCGLHSSSRASNDFVCGHVQVFDGDNDRFISFEEFEQGLRALVAGKAKVRFNPILIRF